MAQDQKIFHYIITLSQEQHRPIPPPLQSNLHHAVHDTKHYLRLRFIGIHFEELYVPRKPNIAPFHSLSQVQVPLFDHYPIKTSACIKYKIPTMSQRFIVCLYKIDLQWK
mmetsp:Transcript_14086/g.29619  ORF Transcript_14086/g.29619 Transcript_14086/m.29619 type:complete len:110 (+) Transcript_14086:31-360(+)